MRISGKALTPGRPGRVQSGYRTLERAKVALGVVSERKTLSGKWWEWMWRLPDEDTPLLAQVRQKYPPSDGAAVDTEGAIPAA